jgi:hypothetical protein
MARMEALRQQHRVGFDVAVKNANRFTAANVCKWLLTFCEHDEACETMTQPGMQAES